MWRGLPGSQEAPRSSSGRPRVQFHSTAVAQGCLRSWAGGSQGRGSIPPASCTPQNLSLPLLLTTVEGDPRSLTEVSSRKGAPGTPTLALDITPPLPQPATSCYHPKRRHPHPPPPGLWLPPRCSRAPSPTPCSARACPGARSFILQTRGSPWRARAYPQSARTSSSQNSPWGRARWNSSNSSSASCGSCRKRAARVPRMAHPAPAPRGRATPAAPLASLSSRSSRAAMGSAASPPGRLRTLRRGSPPLPRGGKSPARLAGVQRGSGRRPGVSGRGTGGAPAPLATRTHTAKSFESFIIRVGEVSDPSLHPPRASQPSI